MTEKRTRLMGAAVVLCLVFTMPVIAQESAGGSAVIQRLNDALLAAMKSGEEAGFEGRFKGLAPVIDETHDLEYIARFAIGRKSWNGLTPEQQQKFLQAFRDFSIASYAARFDGFAGERFAITGEKPAKRGRIQVDSILHLADEDIDFEYILDQQDGQWKIVNVIAQGVSDLALKRAEYKTLISDEGFAALVDHIEDQTDELEN